MSICVEIIYIYADSKGSKLQKRLTFQKAVYGETEVLLPHLLLAIALGMTPLKEKKRN